MAGRTQQYLRTEYIQPPANLPTLDATKCPLALLAQTCSAIGKDTGSKSKYQSSAPKYIHHPAETKKESAASTGDEHYERNGNSSPDVKRISQAATATAERLSVSSPNPRSSIKRKSPELPVVSSQQQAKKTRRDEQQQRFSPSSSPVQMNGAESREGNARLSSPSAVNQNGHSRGSYESNSSSSPKSHSPKSLPHNKLSSPSASSQVPSSLGYHASSLAPPTSSCYDGLKSASQIPPYLSFPNPAGPYSLYAQMMAAAANRTSPASTAESLPHACNWVSRETGTCGKRFSTAEELFTHLRSHAVSNNVMPPTNSYLPPGLDKLSTSPYASYVNQQAAALAALSSSMPSQMGMNFLSNGYNPLSRYPSFKNSPLLNSHHPALSPLAARAPGMSPFWNPFVMSEPMFDARTLSYI